MTIRNTEITLNLPDWDGAIQRLAEQAVTKAAFLVEQQAKESAAVDTGAMRAGISVVTARTSDFDANVAAAQALNPKATFGPSPETADPLEAYVSSPASYSAYVEFGTVKMRAQPFLTPAVEAAIPAMEQALAELGGSLEKDLGGPA